MAIELVCSCGRVVRGDDPPAGGQARCPACGAFLSVTAASESSATPEESHVPGARKPLWALMGKAPAAPSPEPAAFPAVRKGLWGVMQSTPAVPGLPSDSTQSENRNPKSERPVSPVPVFAAPVEATAGHPDAALASVIGISPPEPAFLSQKHAAAVRPGPSRKARLAVSLGGVSILLSFLALVNAFWSKIPATLVGFAAILLGMQAGSEIQRSAGRQTGRKLVIAGIICGVAGVFLGPLILAGVGRRMWQASTRSLTEGHLQTIGRGLNLYHDKEGVFPPGGVFKPGKDKRQRGYHGWTTLLLPYVGEDRLYRQIQLDLPFDDPANLPAFEEDVEVFFASGTDRAKDHRGLGVIHFAGVGGAVEMAGGGVARAGLFSINSRVRRQDVSDGLSNTLAAGEIADELPAWGDPENWRTIGNGLNRERQGFGNHDRSGACFLMADGSVRFFSNKISPQVLTALSTRDGGEPIEK